MNLLQKISAQIYPLSPTIKEAAQARHLQLTKPPGSLGHLEQLGVKLAAIQGTVTPYIGRKRIIVCAADHGVTAEGVSAYPRDVTYQMVMNFVRGGAAINVLARQAGIEIQVVDTGVDFDFPADLPVIHRKIVRGTANFAQGPALTQTEVTACLALGIDLANQAAAEQVSLLGIGEMGIGNTTAASAITAVLTGIDPALVTGSGTGVEGEALNRKIGIVRKAIATNQPQAENPVDILAKVGGAEIGVLVGIVLGAAANRIPVVADGFISTAGAALAVAIQPAVCEYLFLAHRSVEPGHAALLDFIGLSPILDLQLRLGEGTGAALAMPILESAARILSEMATFSEAGISEKTD